MFQFFSSASIGKAVIALSTLPMTIGLNTLTYTDNVTKYDIKSYAIYDNMKDIGESNNKYTTLGEFLPNSYQILLSDRIEKASEHERVLYHEIGHLVDTKDGVVGYYSSMPEFKENCFNKEKYALQGYSKEYFFTDKEKEYFAECYSMYVLNRTALEKYGQNTLAFFDKIMAERQSEMSDATYHIKVEELRKAREGTPASIVPIED